MHGDPRDYPLTRESQPIPVSVGWVGYDITLDPFPELRADRYPVERVRVVAHPDGRVHAYPLTAPNRTWAHRNPGRPDGLGDLCLWYERDPNALRWLPEDGLVELVTIVHRHLTAEEYQRRHGRWPGEDAPHGHPTDRAAHPIWTPTMQQAVTTWAR